jgi:hypothetical protein
MPCLLTPEIWLLHEAPCHIVKAWPACVARDSSLRCWPWFARYDLFQTWNLRPGLPQRSCGAPSFFERRAWPICLAVAACGAGAEVLAHLFKIEADWLTQPRCWCCIFSLCIHARVYAASAVQRQSWLMIRVCDGPVVLHAVLPQQHGALRGVGALHWNGAAVSFSDGRQIVEGYPILQPACIPVAFTKELGACHKGRRTRKHLEGCASSKCVLPHAVTPPLVASTQCALVDTDHIPYVSCGGRSIHHHSHWLKHQLVC